MGAQPPDCPVCRRPEAVFYALGRDRLFRLSPAAYPLYRCRSCGCIFQHPMPEETALAGFYPAGYWWSEPAIQGRAMTRLVGRLERLYRESVIRDHVHFLRRCARDVSTANQPRLLDIGCGSGIFLAAARRRGFSVFGMDVSERAASSARAQYGLDVRCGGIGAELWRDSSFDFVTMFHVLEHVPDPLRAIRYAATLLKPSGRLIVQVPNTASIQARLFGPRWYGLDVPRHVVNFSPAALELLLAQAQLQIQVQCRFSLRDNPAALASSIAVGIDPVGRMGRGSDAGGPVVRALLDFVYLGLFAAALPFAALESAFGRGATLWVAAGKSVESAAARG